MEYSLRFAGGQEINIQKSLTSMVFVSVARPQCLWGTADHDAEPPRSIGAPRHGLFGGAPPTA